MRDVREGDGGVPFGVAASDGSRGLRVVHLLAPAPFGGLESVVLALAGAQRDAGDHVLVVAVESDGGQPSPFVDAVRATGLSVLPVPASGRRYWRERDAVGKILDDERPDLLHTHGYRPDVLDAPVARRRGIPTITTVHGFTGGGMKNRAYEWLQKRSFRRFDAVVAVSRRLRDEMVSWGVPSERVHAIPNAWEPGGSPVARSEARRYLGLDEGTPTLGWVGRMSPEKGPDVMIRALAAMASPETHLSMMGSGTMEEECRRLADRLGISSRCRWHGVVPEAASLLRAFDAIVLTSWTEGTPMILLEAMAAGVPIVSTSVGGVPDVVSAEEAVLVSSGDVPALARAVEEVLADPQASTDRARAAKLRLERDFSVQPWAHRYRKVYQTVLRR
jgi:glycosyltransferase involved in cell wall biosynthesis